MIATRARQVDVVPVERVLAAGVVVAGGAREVGIHRVVVTSSLVCPTGFSFFPKFDSRCHFCLHGPKLGGGGRNRFIKNIAWST